MRNGAVLAKANTAYPELWAYLHKAENAWKCKTLAQWNALSSAAGGVGGVPFFVVDDTAKTIKLPDTRGDYSRCAGSSYLQAVGAWHQDAIVNITGTLGGQTNEYGKKASRAFRDTFLGPNNSTGQYGVLKEDFDASRVVRTAADNRTRTYATLGCVYVGNAT